MNDKNLVFTPRFALPDEPDLLDLLFFFYRKLAPQWCQKRRKGMETILIFDGSSP